MINSLKTIRNWAATILRRSYRRGNTDPDLDTENDARSSRDKAGLLPTKDFAVSEQEAERPNLIYYQMGGKKRKAHATWYRGENTNFHPMRSSLKEHDFIEKYVGFGWFPKEPFIQKDQYITAFGSCFAAEVTNFLLTEGYSVFGGDLKLDAGIVRSGEGIANSASLRQQFEWAYGYATPRTESWHRKDGSLSTVSDEGRGNTRRVFDATEIFIFTLGLSEVWYDKDSQEVFWRAIPADMFDDRKHGFRVLGADENRENIRRVYELVRLHRPAAHIIFTLSPIPLAATFRPISCITANSVSKASLRIAIDEVMREFEEDSKLHYFPSYEIVTATLDNAFGDDLRHPRPETIDFLMQIFKKYFLR